MFGTSFVLPHADGNISCIKINQDSYSSEYLSRSSLGQTTVKIRHSSGKPTANGPGKDRHNVEVVQTIFATAEAAEIVRKVYVVIEQLPSDVDIKLVDALADWLIASAGVNITSLLSWES